MAKKKLPQHLRERIAAREEHEAFEEHLVNLRRNPPDTMTIPTGDGKAVTFRMPKVRPGRRRLH